MKSLVAATAVMGLLALTPDAWAGSKQTHHCYKDGQLQEGKTKKQCLAEGGTWQADTDAAGKPTTTPDRDDPSNKGGR
jgi:hypothetical protein